MNDNVFSVCQTKVSDLCVLCSLLVNHYLFSSLAVPEQVSGDGCFLHSLSVGKLTGSSNTHLSEEVTM